MIVLTGMEAYYFTDGNFAPADVEVYYRDDAGAWVKVGNPVGLSVELNQYNKTTFDPVVTNGIRMIMTPKTLGCGVIEWKVYGYSDRIILDKAEVTDWINRVQALDVALFEEEAMVVLQSLVEEAKALLENAEATQADLDTVVERMKEQ